VTRQPNPQQIDLNELASRVPPGDFLMVASLVLLFAFSFVGCWFHASYGSYSVDYDTLWDGFGYLPAFLLLFAMGFYAVRKLPQFRLDLPVPDWQVWLGFSGLEIVLFLLHWLIDKGPGGPGVSFRPGWTLFVAVFLVLTLAAGGYLQGQRISVGEPTDGFGGSGNTPGSYPRDSSLGASVPLTEQQTTAPVDPPTAPINPAEGSQASDGTSPHDTEGTVPPDAPRSEDGYYWWDGKTWRPVPGGPQVKS